MIPDLATMLFAVVAVVAVGLALLISSLADLRGCAGPGCIGFPLGIDRAMTIDLWTRTVAAEQQETITRDGETVKVNAVLWWRVTDASLR